MSKGKTESKMRIGERKQKAFEGIKQGLTNVEIAKRIKVSPGTVSRYRKDYIAQISDQARNNPDLLRDVLGNTIKALEELDLVKAEAWKLYNRTNSETTKISCLARITACQDQRAKLFGLFGVKAEFFLHVDAIRQQQSKLLEFMGEHLCPTDRIALEAYIVSAFAGELAAMPTAEEPTHR